MFNEKTKILFTFQETYLEPKSIPNLCLATVAIATEPFQNDRQIEFNRVYIVNGLVTTIFHQNFTL